MSSNTKLRYFLIVLLLISVAVCPGFLNIFCGLALASAGQHDKANLLFASSVLLMGTVPLVLLKKNIAAIALSLIGTVMCLYASRMHAAEALNGDLAKNLQTPTVIVTVFVLLIAACYWFSDEFREKNEAKKKAKEKPFESIL